MNIGPVTDSRSEPIFIGLLGKEYLVWLAREGRSESEPL